MVSKIRKEDLLLFCCCLFSCSQPTLLHSHRSIHIHTYPYPISPKSLLLRSPPIFPSKLNAPRSLPSPILTMKLHVIPACKWVGVEHLVVHWSCNFCSSQLSCRAGVTISTLIPTFEQLILISLCVSIVLPFIFRPNVQIRRNHHRLTPYTDILLLPKPLPGHKQRTNNINNNGHTLHQPPTPKVHLR